MIRDVSGAEVMWDHQIFTFMGVYQGTRVGKFSGDIVSVVDLEAALGVALSAETGAELQAQMLAAPYEGAVVLLTKNQFMDLFRPEDLVKIYAMARSQVPEEQLLSIGVQIELDRLNRVADLLDITSSTTRAGLAKMEFFGLIAAGDAQRITKGIPWQP